MWLLFLASSAKNKVDKINYSFENQTKILKITTLSTCEVLNKGYHHKLNHKMRTK